MSYCLGRLSLVTISSNSRTFPILSSPPFQTAFIWTPSVSPVSHALFCSGPLLVSPVLQPLKPRALPRLQRRLLSKDHVSRHFLLATQARATRRRGRKKKKEVSRASFVQKLAATT